MAVQRSSTNTLEHPDARDGSETRLHGRWLLSARVGWVVLTLLVLTLNAIAIPRADALSQSVERTRCQQVVERAYYQLIGRMRKETSTFW